MITGDAAYKIFCMLYFLLKADIADIFNKFLTYKNGHLLDLILRELALFERLRNNKSKALNISRFL